MGPPSPGPVLQKTRIFGKYTAGTPLEGSFLKEHFWKGELILGYLKSRKPPCQRPPEDVFKPCNILKP